jgi:hypothetical protein
MQETADPGLERSASGSAAVVVRPEFRTRATEPGRTAVVPQGSCGVTPTGQRQRQGRSKAAVHKPRASPREVAGGPTLRFDWVWATTTEPDPCNR